MFFFFLLSSILVSHGLAQSTGSSFSSFLPYVSAETREQKSAVVLNPIHADGPIDTNYVLGPGDFLEILVNDHTVTVQISPEGAFSLERIGLIYVSGLTLAQARKKIIDALSAEYPKRYSYVHLAQIKSFSVHISGAIAIPGSYHISANTRLNHVIRMAGGILSTGDERHIQIIQDSDTMRVDYYAVEYQGNRSQDPILKPGQHIYIPFLDYNQPHIIIRLQERQWFVPWTPDLTLLEALKQSGAIRAKDAFAYVRIAPKHSSPRPDEWQEFSQVTHASIPENTVVELLPEMRFIYLIGSMAAPGKHPYIPNQRVVDYLGASGITPISGSLEKASVLRDGKTISVDPYRDIILPGDIIYLPKDTFESTKEMVAFISQVVGILVSAVTFYVLLTRK